jgi:hypothetical protein
MSDEQSRAFVWDHQEDDYDDDSALNYMDQEDEDRLYSFEITQTNEQEESVVAREGFCVINALSDATCRLTILVSRSSRGL